MPSLCKRCGKELPAGILFCPVCDGSNSAPLPSSAGQTGLTQKCSQPQMKLVTVLSADFQGFTAFTATRDAEEVREFITFCWKQIGPLIEAHGGRVDKYIGDAVVALFGAEQAREEDPVRAVQAALAIQTRLRQLEAEGSQPLLPMRIGIHTGRVVIETEAAGMSAFGDTICVADRVQKRALTGSVLISHDTYRHVRDRFDVQPPQLEVIDGRKEPVRAYVVLGPKPRSRRRPEGGIEGVEAAMVGRDAELELLRSTLRATMEKQEPSLVTIVGEPGLGKSRLLSEFLKEAALLSDSLRVFCGRSTAEMSVSPFALLRDLLAAQFDIQEGDSAAIAKEKLETGVAALLASPFPDPAEDSPERVAHFLGQLAGLNYSASPHLQGGAGDPEQFRARAFHSAVRLFTAASLGSLETAPKSGRHAALLVAEDIHWSDEGSLQLIAHLATASAGAPLMIICLSRPELFERRPGWGKDLLGHKLIRLAPLPGNDSCSLVKKILSQAREIPAELLERVVGDAEGNPFYIEEIIKMLIEQSVIQPGPESWKVELTSKPYVVVPPTLTGVLQARLDALQPQERTIAQRASVVGRVFWDAALEYLERPDDVGARDPAPDRQPSQFLMAEPLAELCRKQIICRLETSSQAGAIEYSFSHDLLRNVAYEGMLKKTRQGLHRSVAYWLIRRDGERVNESASMVAGHFEKAGCTAEAADWNGRAGHQASVSHLPAAAAEFFRKALEQSAQAGEKAGGSETKCLAWFDGLAESLTAQAKFSEARDAYLRMRQLAATSQELLTEARANNGLSFLHERQGNNQASIEAADQTIELCQRAGAAGRGEKFRALYFKGWAYYRLADAGKVLDLAAQCRELCSELDDQAGMARTFKLYGVAHLQLGHYAEADQYFQEGLKISEQNKDLVTVAAMWSNRAETARARGDYESAVTLYETALAITQRIGWRDSERIYLCNLSAARIGLRQFAQAEADLHKVIAQATPAGAWNLPEALILLSEACLEQGKTNEALETGWRAVELARSSGNCLFMADAWRAVARALAADWQADLDGVRSHQAINLSGDPDQCFEESLRVYRQIGARGEEARTLRMWAEFDLQRHHINSSQEKLQKASGIFQELGMTSEMDKVNVLLDSPAALVPAIPL